MFQQVPNTSNDDSWKSQTFRQSVVAKIEGVIQKRRVIMSKTSVEMENRAFIKAKTKEEYLAFVARLITHLSEINLRRNLAPYQLMNQRPKCLPKSTRNCFVSYNGKTTIIDFRYRLPSPKENGKMMLNAGMINNPVPRTSNINTNSNLSIRVPNHQQMLANWNDLNSQSSKCIETLQKKIAEVKISNN